MFLRFKLFLI